MAETQAATESTEQCEQTSQEKLIKHLNQLADKIANTDYITAPMISNPIPSPPPSDTSFGTFHPFPLLPAEIRLEIWALNLPEGHEPHVLHVNFRHDQYPSIYGNPSSTGAWVIENPINDPLANLWTCRESRFEALKSRSWQGYDHICLHDNHGDYLYKTMRTWFNFETDTLFLNTSTPVIPNAWPPIPPRWPFSWEFARKLRFFAISLHFWKTWPFLAAGSCRPDGSPHPRHKFDWPPLPPDVKRKRAREDFFGYVGFDPKVMRKVLLSAEHSLVPKNFRFKEALSGLPSCEVRRLGDDLREMIFGRQGWGFEFVIDCVNIEEI